MNELVPNFFFCSPIPIDQYSASCGASFHAERHSQILRSIGKVKARTISLVESPDGVEHDILEQHNDNQLTRSSFAHRILSFSFSSGNHFSGCL